VVSAAAETRPAPDWAELLTTTRAVRRGLDQVHPVDLEVVKECLRIALQAPTGGNRQNWHWIVVADPERRAGLARIYRAAFEDRYGPRQHTESVSAPVPVPVPGARAAADADAEVQAHGMDAPDAVPVPSASDLRLLADARYLAEHLHNVPVLVVPCLELGTDRLPEGNQAGVWASLLPAAWSYALAARAHGLGTVLTTVHLGREREAAELLGLPPTVHQGGLLPTARSLRSAYRPAARRPLHEVLHLDGWDPTPSASSPSGGSP
jgi:nitroreductase